MIEEIRGLLSADHEGSLRAFRKIWKIFEDCDHNSDEYLVAVDYTEQHMTHWDDDARTPEAYHSITSFHLPHWKLARCFGISVVDKIHCLMESLQSSPWLENLRTLRMSYCQQGQLDLHRLRHTTSLKNLRHLRVYNCHLEDEDVAPIFESPQMAGLQRLELGGNNITDNGVEQLAASSNMCSLKILDLRNNPIGYSGALALASSPNMNGLTELNLCGTNIGITGTQLLLNSEHLYGLDRLVISPHRMLGPSATGRGLITDTDVPWEEPIYRIDPMLGREVADGGPFSGLTRENVATLLQIRAEGWLHDDIERAARELLQRQEEEDQRNAGAAESASEEGDLGVEEETEDPRMQLIRNYRGFHSL